MSRSSFIAWFTLVVVLTLAGSATADGVKPLSKAHRAAIASIQHDPAPDSVIQDTHYFVSNERHPHRFYESLKSVGGMYVGVGAEQSYLFSGWAAAEVIIHADFDQMVVDVHTLYGIFFLGSSDADAFIARWDKKNDKAARQLVERAIPEGEDRTRVLRAFEKARPGIHPRLWGLQLRYSNMGIPTFLTDSALYSWMVAMHREGRVRAVRCDLTGDKAMKSIAAAAKKLGLPVRGLYLSNVEFYFNYDSGLGANLRRLPTDADSVVIRTYPFKQKDADYRYFVQKLSDFHAWLDTEVESFRAMFTKDSGTLKKDVWYLRGPT